MSIREQQCEQRSAVFLIKRRADFVFTPKVSREQPRPVYGLSCCGSRSSASEVELCEVTHHFTDYSLLLYCMFLIFCHPRFIRGTRAEIKPSLESGLCFLEQLDLCDTVKHGELREPRSLLITVQHSVLRCCFHHKVSVGGAPTWNTVYLGGILCKLTLDERTHNELEVMEKKK